MQKVYGADDRTLITALAVDVPDRASRRISGQLRAVVAIAAAGLVALLFLLSVAVAVSQFRRDAPLRPQPPRTGPVAAGRAPSGRVPAPLEAEQARAGG